MKNEEIINECLVKLAEAGVTDFSVLENKFDELTFLNTPEGKKYTKNIEETSLLIQKIRKTAPVKIFVTCELSPLIDFTPSNLSYSPEDIRSYQVKNVNISVEGKDKINTATKKYITGQLERIVPCDMADSLFDKEYRAATKKINSLIQYFSNFNSKEVVQDVNEKLNQSNG